MSPKLKSRYHCRDARELSSILHRECIDVTITSPPYWALKDYGASKQIGTKQSYEDYLLSLQNIFRQIFANTKQSGSLWVIADTFKHRSKIKLLPFELVNILEPVGWKLCDIIIWNKTKTLPWSRKAQLRNIFEYILFFTKSGSFKYYLDRVKEPEHLKQWWVKSFLRDITLSERLQPICGRFQFQFREVSVTATYGMPAPFLLR